MAMPESSTLPVDARHRHGQNGALDETSVTICRALASRAALPVRACRVYHHRAAGSDCDTRCTDRAPFTLGRAGDDRPAIGHATPNADRATAGHAHSRAVPQCHP